LRSLNHALIRQPFRILTLKSNPLAESEGCILSHPGSPPSQTVLKILRVYQYTVLPFGLSKALHTSTKCIDVALSPLEERGIRVLNYLNDWLLLAQSKEELCTHISLLLNHLECLRFRINLSKSSL